MYPDIKQLTLDLLDKHIEPHKFSNLADVRIVDDLGMDSLDTVELIVNLEQKLDTTIEEKYLVGVRTIQDLISAINTALAKH